MRTNVEKLRRTAVRAASNEDGIILVAAMLLLLGVSSAWHAYVYGAVLGLKEWKQATR